MRNIDFIDKKKYYSLLTIYNMKWFDWIHSYDALRRLVRKDIIDNENKIFKVVTYGSSNGKRYLIKGNVIVAINNKIKKGFEFNKK